VAQATAEVVNESDAFGQWLAGHEAEGVFTPTLALFESWVRQHPMSHIKTVTAFARELNRFPQYVKATKRINSKEANGYIGLVA
jgi:hypothetical protein